MKYIIPYRKVRRQMDMESEGELVRFFIEQRVALWQKDKKSTKNRRIERGQYCGFADI